MGIALTSTLLLCLVRGEPETQYVFVEDLKRDWVLSRDGYFIGGRLDARGEFSETKRVKANGFISGSMRLGQLLNRDSLLDTSVYELRSGTLIPGTMDEKGYFIPEVGGKVIKFSDYKYKPSGPVIWNLPGEFVKKESK